MPMCKMELFFWSREVFCLDFPADATNDSQRWLRRSISLDENPSPLLLLNRTMQKLLVSFAMPAGRQVTSSDVLYSLHWLPVRRRIEFKTATLCFKAVRLGNPPYLKNMLKPYEPLRSLRSSTMDLLTVPRTDTSFGLRRFSVAAPRIWNGLPHEL